MTPELDKRIQNVGTLSTEAFLDLHKIQQGEKKLVRTGQEMIDCHIGGLLPSDVVIIAGAPSTGKSQTLYEMLDDMLNVEVNPDADKFVSLEYSMEMKMLNKILRATNNLLNKRKTDILFEQFTEEEKVLVRKYHEALQDERRFVCQSPVSPKEFYTMTRDFCLAHADKEAIIISGDHVLLFTGSDKQSVLEQISEYINLLKLEFSNAYFLFLSQTNRSSTATIKEKDNSMMPNNSMLFGSSFMEQLASYIIIINNPFKLAVNQYLKVNPDRYKYLSSFFGDVDTKGKVSFNTIGNLFYTITKTRESDHPYKDLFIRKMKLTGEQFQKLKESVDNIEVVKPIFMPVFEKETQPPPQTLTAAFGTSFQDNNKIDDPF